MKQIQQAPLAGRGARLGAATIDSLIFAGSVTPGVVSITSAGTDMGVGFGIALLIFAWILLLVVQATFLIKRGQSLGKMVVGIRIVKASDESVPGFAKVFVLRMLVPNLLSGIPVVGVIFALADYLFIFRDDRRCLHDLVAETKVIDASVDMQSDSYYSDEQDFGGTRAPLPEATRNASARYPKVPDEFQTSFVNTTPELLPRRNSETAPKVVNFGTEQAKSESKRSPNNPVISKNGIATQGLPGGHIPDEAYAEAMAEIDESRTVKGLWVRCYAESDGDEKRTKAAYLSKRAEALATEINHRLFVEAQANRRAKEISTLMEGVNANDPSALFKMGMLFRTENELVKPNEVKAITCIAKAAFLWHTEAQNQLSMMYWNGDGVPQSKCDALAWCRCAGVNDASYWKRVSQWMTQIDSPEVTESDEIVASINAVKDSPTNLEGAIAAFKTRNISLANSRSKT